MLVRFYKSLYLNSNLFYAVGVVVFLYLIGYQFATVYVLAHFALIGLSILVGLEVLILYRIDKGISGTRVAAERFSNGDQNTVTLHISNHYPQKVTVEIIDEVPIQFQAREHSFQAKLAKRGVKTLQYQLRPTERGAYSFGHINVFASTSMHLVQRRFEAGEVTTVAVYPSFLQTKEYEFLAISNDLQQLGVKKIRRIGHNYEFDHIRKFVIGDDYRSINWKATARTGDVMMNQFQDEKSQNVYAVINMGRVMKMPFEGLTLLDYAINSSLVILNTAMLRDDRAGLVTFNEEVQSVLRASKSKGHLTSIMETLYAQKTKFGEGNYERLYYRIHKEIGQRSLLFLYTNFESMVSLKREMHALISLSRNHLLVVVLFKNTELESITKARARNVEELYIKTIANKFQNEKELIAKELEVHGIHSILTEPGNLTVNSINKYLELKARGLI